MKHNQGGFHEEETLHRLKHYLPSQAPLKDFIHHNTLHAFQHEPFFPALNRANRMLGYKTQLSITEYRELYNQGSIRPEVLQRCIARKKGETFTAQWMHLLLKEIAPQNTVSRIGKLRDEFKNKLKINLDKEVHPLLFRLLGNFLDQGISIRPFPAEHKSFLSSVREIVKNSRVSLFKTRRCEHLLLHTHSSVADLLSILIGDETLFEQYLFDQQFAHPGWSGMVAVLEHSPETLLNKRKITLHELIYLELLLEIDAIDAKLGPDWKPLYAHLNEPPASLFAPCETTDHDEALSLFQEAFEWSYYDQVLNGIEKAAHVDQKIPDKKFDALFCIDDRECSLRRYIEQLDAKARTWGTPGFFNVAFYYQPEHSRFHTKVCPAPLTPTHIIKEYQTQKERAQDAHFAKNSHSVLFGWLISQTLGFWSAVKLFVNIFKPGISPATTYSFNHMDKRAKLTIENKHPEDRVFDCQIGFTTDEMTHCVEGLLKSIGLTDNFGRMVYVVGHGASSINNTHYAGYDCGACSGRPGSVNARVVSFMANHTVVRKNLLNLGIVIPEETVFVGGLHDTTRDEIEFYDDENLSDSLQKLHQENRLTFEKALSLNAKERSRRFVLTNTKDEPARVHEHVKLRSVSLFEPRPELNHATNTLCIVGRRGLTDHLFLDRRAFLNSYDYRIDPEGKYLFNILKAASPVCGGINLEYFFSRVDNHRLGAGTKLPHNVMGLIGVANGADGDLRTGLPWQMVEVHDPLRLLVVVEHFPDTILKVIQSHPETYEWYHNNWVNLIGIHPETGQQYRFTEDYFELYKPLPVQLTACADLNALIEHETQNIPVQLLMETI